MRRFSGWVITISLVLSAATAAAGTEPAMGDVVFPGGAVQVAAAPTWGDIVPGAGRWQSVLGGAAALDAETGLVWQLQTPGFVRGWSASVGYCSALKLGGRGGWRLPTIEELMSLVDPAVSNPALPAGHPFTDAPAVLSNLYWSASSWAPRPTVKWAVHFGTGSATYSIGGAKHARCVRGG